MNPAHGAYLRTVKIARALLTSPLYRSYSFNVYGRRHSWCVCAECVRLCIYTVLYVIPLVWRGAT